MIDKAMKRMRNIRMRSLLLAITTVGFIFYLSRIASSNLDPAIGNDDPAGGRKVVEEATGVKFDDSYSSGETDLEVFKVDERELREDWKQSVKENEVTIDYRTQSQREDITNNLKTISVNSERVEFLADLKQLNSSGSNLRQSTSSGMEYLIVEYTKVFFQPKFCSKTSQEIFNSAIESCPYKNCKYTCNKDKDTVSKANVLVFHLRDLEVEFGSEQFKSNYNEWFKATQQLPFKSPEEKLANNKHQLWLLWNDESTPINRNLNQLSNLFNWTMSFKTNSEVYEGSYGFLKTKSGLTIEKVQQMKQQIYSHDYKARRNAILWFVSNCNSKYRIKIALEISKHYPVYVFGKCNIVKDMSPDEVKRTYPYLNSMGGGDELSAARNGNPPDDDSFLRNDAECGPGSECEEKRFKSFKYYLAFENRNCTDYITEKIWRSLTKSIIPIVLQPAKESYLKYQIPSGSFIHLQDFDQDIVKLVTYLKEMNNNFKLYYDHLKWTSVYTEGVWQAEHLEPHRMCQLCKLLNTYDKNIYYNNIVDFFNNQCSDPL